MADLTITDLPAASTLTGNEEIAIYQSGETKKAGAGAIAALGSGGGYTVVTGTLSAGSTTLTLQDASITTSSTLDFYTDAYGVNPTAVSVSTGSVTLTFEAQQTNIAVKVRVW